MKTIQRDTEKFYELNKDQPEMIILHHFERYEKEDHRFNSTESIVDFLSGDYREEAPYSCNAVIDTNGDIYLIGSDYVGTYHAGKSYLHGKHDGFHSVNRVSYGIEIIRSQEENFEYTGAQYLATASLVSDLMDKFGITFPWIASHEMIRDEYNAIAEAKDDMNFPVASKKNDPLNFDWNLFFDVIQSQGVLHTILESS